MTPDAPTPATSGREAVTEWLARGDAFRAFQAGRALLEKEPGLRTINFLANAAKRSDAAGLKPFKVALLSSFSIEFLHPFLVGIGFLNRLKIEIYQAGFNQFRQEILDPRSGLYAFAPDAVVLAVEGKEVAPALYANYLDGIDSGFDGALAQAKGDLAGWIETFRKRSSAALVVHDFAPPTWPQLGVLDGHVGVGQAQLVRALNDALLGLAKATPGTYVLDYAGLVARHGQLRWFDERMAHYAKAPIHQEMLAPLAAEQMKFFRALAGFSRKCLVVDLDNTLWGGVLGEEGMAGIDLGPNYPGSAYVAFQKEILNLRKRGILLAVASKNNPADVDEIFTSHPHQVLKKEHFTSLEINWEPKSASLRRIAEQLSIGLDHIVFVDDNPVEFEEVTGALPMVTGILLPKQPEGFVQALLAEGLFDTLGLSAEDRQRGELYHQRAMAEEMKGQSGSLEDFLRGLEMGVLVTPVGDANLARSAQLTQKTNQFNATTIRYSEAELRKRMADPAWILETVKVTDRFGDHGVVGLVMARAEDRTLDIDTFLMSCRVIGRMVETSMLASLSEQATRRGLSQLRGTIVPTAKNVPARDLFERHGFTRVRESEGGKTEWLLDLSKNAVTCPEWIRLERDAGAAG